jgi:hypothetical protein
LFALHRRAADDESEPLMTFAILVPHTHQNRQLVERLVAFEATRPLLTSARDVFYTAKVSPSARWGEKMKRERFF